MNPAGPETPSPDRVDRAATKIAGGRRDFLEDVVETVRRQLPGERQSFRHKFGPNLVKFDYGNDRVHYEVWINGEGGWIEVGLHFEDGPVSTAAYLRGFDASIVEIKDRLGTDVEMERWTSSWGRIYVNLPVTSLTPEVRDAATARLVPLILTLQPMVESFAVKPEYSSMSPEQRKRKGWW